MAKLSDFPRSDKGLKSYISKTYHVELPHNFLKFVPTLDGGIKVISSENLQSWKKYKKVLLTRRKGYFDASRLHLLDAMVIDEGILLVYFVRNPFAIGAALLSKADYELVLWRSAEPIWTTTVKNIRPIGVTKLARSITVHIERNKKLETVKFSLDYLFGKLEHRRRYIQSAPVSIVQRSNNNPIILPKLEHHWESSQTYNAAAIYLNGKVHFLYRAIGGAGMSVLGYAASADGIHIDERLTEPVYMPTEPFEFRKDRANVVPFDYSSGGGGWGGCEDPRMTKVGDTIYMTYTAWNGVEAPGVALTSIKVADFLHKKWKWKRPVLISPRGKINKNWVIFPELINGKYAILHSITPEIYIDYFANLDFDGTTTINSFHGPSLRNEFWDNQMRGAGPPPIKTSDGWLLLYHAMDWRDPNKYKLGAMLLDLDDPTKVICRAPFPVLEPMEDYENIGYKGGVIYVCGAVVMNNQLFVYYGSADTTTCVATADLGEFLMQLRSAHVLVSPGLTVKTKVVAKKIKNKE